MFGTCVFCYVVVEVESRSSRVKRGMEGGAAYLLEQKHQQHRTLVLVHVLATASPVGILASIRVARHLS